MAIVPSGREVRRIEFAIGRELGTLSAPDPQPILWLCFSSDGRRLAAATGNRVLQVWTLWGIRERLAEMGLDWK